MLPSPTPPKCPHCEGKKKNANLCSKHFNALKKTWYGKLKDKGFEDEEQDEDNLKFWTSTVFTSKCNGSFYKDKISYYEAQEEYYRLAGQFFYDHKFKNKAEKHIWELHSQGLSIRTITDKLQEKGADKAYRRAVHETLQALTKIMVATCLKK